MFHGALLKFSIFYRLWPEYISTEIYCSWLRFLRRKFSAESVLDLESKSRLLMDGRAQFVNLKWFDLKYNLMMFACLRKA